MSHEGATARPTGWDVALVLLCLAGSIFAACWIAGLDGFRCWLLGAAAMLLNRMAWIRLTRHAE